MRKLVKVVSGLVIAVSFVGAGAQAVSADEIAPKLASAEEMPTNPAIKKGDKIFVVQKDTKKQRVNLVNSQNKLTKKTVKMGKTFTVKQVKKVGSHKICQIGNQKQWLRAKDVVAD